MKSPTGTGSKGAGEPGCLKALKLLVVEDHADMRTGLSVLFKLLGCQARFVPDVASARAAICDERFDVLLSDINLPDGNGWDFLRDLHARGLRPPTAIAMSGFGSDGDIATSRDAGFEVHLIKPFAPGELTAILHRAAETLAEKESRSSSTPRKRKRAEPQAGAFTYPSI